MSNILTISNTAELSYSAYANLQNGRTDNDFNKVALNAISPLGMLHQVVGPR